MTFAYPLFGLALLAGLTFLFYWLFVTTEGVFLGRRMVIWLYDLTAGRYDGIKQYNTEDETILVVEPVLAHLRHANALVVDVATGTGRVPRFLLADARFEGRVVGVDASRRMLDHARVPLAAHQGRVDLVRGLAEALPLPAACAQVVTCLESLEFIPNQSQAVAEMVRVLQPGGALLITRRCGWEARLFFGRYRTTAQFEAFLSDHGLERPTTYPWQNNYNLVIARKPR